MSKWVKLPDYYWEGYALMNQNEDIVDYTKFWEIFIFLGRSSAVKCLYSLGVMAYKIISRTVVISLSDITADSEFTAHP